MKTNKIFAGSAEGVSAAEISNNINNNNNAETLKGLIIAGHDGAKDYGSGENGMNFNFAWGDYKIFVVRSYGVWKMRIYKNWLGVGRFDANLTPNWGGYSFGQRRWSKSLVVDMADAIETITADYEWEHLMTDGERMSDIVASYQTEFDGYMDELMMVAEKYDDIETAFDAYAAKKIIEKMAKVSMDCYDALGEYNGCSMGWDDGWHIDTSELGRWYIRNYDELDDRDMENLIDTLDSVMLDMPLGLDDEQIEWISTDGCGLGLTPIYLDDDARWFVKTWVEYGPCTMPF